MGNLIYEILGYIMLVIIFLALLSWFREHWLGIIFWGFVGAVIAYLLYGWI